MISTITVLGQGAMGSRMADRLDAAGFEVTRWSRSGSDITPREAVARADIALAMLRDDEASRDVWLDAEAGALAGLKKGAIAIESSTLRPDCMRDLGEAASRRGLAFLDAPVLGSRPQAEAGALVHLIGGVEEVVDRAQPLLKAVGAKQLHAGEIGAGASLKLIANTLFATQVALLAELIGRARKLGLDPSATVELLGATPLLSPGAAAAASLMLAGQDDPMFPVNLVRKDLGYAIGEACEAMPIAVAASKAFGRAAAAGMGGANLTAVHRLYD
ncbi:NAD(P)-dependent oxidoreductase [Erythrobacter ani]|uniref:NAD(P)-dependent oxidoreductase n=1 Tax=Erythrobacter ani TaxID=2827235 RepID=A0ABS6SM95_9SPHN|nr:NAD(P)-dependent oxidoreductase [Erythrobacter ani]MBV7266156.1 NAD(P)-dependent oxidoreductase [Erythrobacter ani]